MNICEEIIREIYRLVREEGYHPNLSGIDRIQFSPAGYDELSAQPDVLRDLEIAKDGDKLYGIPVKINRRQEAKFRVICKPPDD